jgi:hypothetical protein
LFVGSANDAYVILPVASTAGYVLSVDSATTSGLAWSEIDLSLYATAATENDNTIMNIMGAY